MTIGTRDDLTQFHSRLFPLSSFVAITKIIWRARAVEHNQLTKIFFAIEHVTQRRSQRRHAGSHRHENQIVSALLIELESASCDVNQFDPLAFFQIEQRE